MNIQTTEWLGKISNHHQLGGIESSVLDNGEGKGTRIAWVNTGSGLRFKVVLDRGMDIAEAFYNEHSLTWLSHVGITLPDPTTISGMNWLRTFGGGLLTTCGLTHIGGAENDESGERGLHDRISHCLAHIESIVQPDLQRGKLEMSLTGRMVQSVVFGHHLELKRTISVKMGVPTIKIHDEVTNLGNQPSPHMLLYHINFGWPLIDKGTQLVWKGKWTAREENDPVFREDGNIKICKSPMDEHRGAGESVAFIDLDTDSNGDCCYEVFNSNLSLRVRVRFKKEQLPWLTNWQHWGANEYVTALEPGTHPPIGQSRARREGSLIFIRPGETREYDLELEVIQ
ncbi:MAG: aldose 1-epimerase family protein [Mangrovibacterium sp.]